jgi:hypothetical protein
MPRLIFIFYFFIVLDANAPPDIPPQFPQLIFYCTIAPPDIATPRDRERERETESERESERELY